MENGVQRWVVDISKWEPSPTCFTSALSILPQHEHSSIIRFVKLEDRKRALVSRLLQYAIVHHVLGIPYHEIIIKRTIEGKPYLACDKDLEFPNFNFNVSHHGDYVAIATEPLCLVGLDVVSYTIPIRETILEYIHNFSSYFSSLEWHNITNADTSDEMLGEFYRYWCLKESYVKAIGTGVAYGLEKVEFHHSGWTNISVKVNGEAMTDWRFWLFEFGKGHWISIARGPPKSATGSYKRTLMRVEFSKEDYLRGLCLPNAPFISKTVEELVADSLGANIIGHVT